MADVNDVYKALGYNEPVQQGGLEAFGDEGEPSPLGPEEVRLLQQRMAENPEQVLQWYRDTWGDHVTEEDIWNALSEAQMSFEQPDAASGALEAFDFFRRAVPLPDGFDFPGIDVDNIPIDPGVRRFETKGDVLGWVLFAGPQFVSDKLQSVQRADFRWHHKVKSNYIYPMDEIGDDGRLDVALFSDFGTGLYHSLYIAKQLRERKLPLAIHLGDVYYSGRRSEFRDFFEAPLNPMLQTTTLYTMNANHEMLAGGIPYFDYIDKRRALLNQFQEGSYFCLRNKQFQIIGIDTAYFGVGRHEEPQLQKWLQTVLQEGKDSGRTNILLSPDEPYSYGEPETSALFNNDLGKFAKLIDLWFWGNTHYCGLFDRNERFPFVGSCIGHGGYPYARVARTNKKDSLTPAPVKFVETRARFPDDTGLRPDMGNNGYCILSLKGDGSAAIEYIDWMSSSRCTAQLAPTNDSLQVATVQEQN